MNITADKVATFHFKLSNAKNEVLDSSHEAEPLPYLHGHNNIMPGLEKAMEGKAVGDQFSVTLHPDDGFGRRDPGLEQTIARSVFGDAELEVGMHYQVEDDEGNLQLVLITDINDKEVAVDGNHPYAGHTLTFDVEIITIRDASAEELEQGRIELP